jgi:Eco47II restriction endonuclease
VLLINLNYKTLLMAKLSWISDKNLITTIEQILQKAKDAKNKSSNSFGKNVIDPFSALFEISGFEFDYNTWHESETARQAQKTLQNHIGDFHQKILGYCNGWENLETGSVIDIVNKKSRIVAEIKNKYNTLSGGKLADLYYSMENLVMNKNSIYKGFTSYYVTIIPKRPIRQNAPFTPSDKAKGSKCSSNPLIREIDGASFYSLATGKNDALQELFDIMPPLISGITGKKIAGIDDLKKFFKKAYN